MAPKEPTRAQLSSRLSYSQHTPAFLRRLQNKYSGNPSYDDDDEDDEQGRYRDEPEFEDLDRGSGRPPIPRRPAIPERPPDDPGSAGEDDEDEKPQIVVLKEGKHLTEREAENIRRKAKGLPPLPDPTPESTEGVAQSKSEGTSDSTTKSKKHALTFSTANPTAKQSAAKRKLDIVGRSSDNEEQDDDERIKDKDSSKKSKTLPASKKQKKNAKTGSKMKTLLSFGDDA